ncbi:response regulator transcription factor [Ignavigranum ruoffiae]|uniref:DNA-binding response regulator, OmpR family, contains REC and winged-helix (WHTH) domain n=1 Tax=Ignavigranum ruoffiae TaxID=89093 RepID=A0A1H9AW04_9LACT|nr:response regulator transcription factor [Ignavigranum ruoffiae]UPQ85206.1 response regulator transcription factor [Ignavigranum ruoffiae]SEP80799.1 DNA-binding response regulator, OmpR family, contains REC and winged-helix (wHTH) domain [Ignavigranum ruoffiae]
MNYYQRRLLLVEDHQEIAQFIRQSLIQAGFQSINWKADFQSALLALDQEAFDLAILDIMLPDGNGYDLLQYIRQSSRMPVLFLSAVSDIEQQYKGFELGADDYIVKPFKTRDLVLRIRSLLKRAYPEARNWIQIGNRRVDFSRAIIIHQQEEIPLTAKEYAILKVLADQPNRIVSFDQIMIQVWGHAYEGYQNSLMAHIHKIRQKIENNPTEPKYLLTMKGLGYKLNLER